MFRQLYVDVGLAPMLVSYQHSLKLDKNKGTIVEGKGAVSVFTAGVFSTMASPVLVDLRNLEKDTTSIDYEMDLEYYTCKGTTKVLEDTSLDRSTKFFAIFMFKPKKPQVLKPACISIKNHWGVLERGELFDQTKLKITENTGIQDVPTERAVEVSLLARTAYGKPWSVTELTSIEVELKVVSDSEDMGDGCFQFTTEDLFILEWNVSARFIHFFFSQQLKKKYPGNMYHFCFAPPPPP